MMTKFDCLVHPDSSLSRMAALLSGLLVEIKPFNWGVYRKNRDGTAVLDKNGDLIVDPLLVFRPAKGKNVSHQKAISIPEKYLFWN